MAPVRIVITGEKAEIFSAYDAKDLIKTMPIRRWDGEAKCWRIPAVDVPDLKALLEVAGFTVHVIDKQPPPTSPPPPRRDGETERLRLDLRRLEREKQRLEQQVVRMRNEAQARTSNWAEDLLRKLTPDQAAKVRKKLTTVLHPDVGGNAELMTDLNVAADRFSSRSWM